MVLKNTGMCFLPLLILENWDKIIWDWTNSYYDMEIKLYNCSWVFKFAVDQAKYLGRRLKLDSALARLVKEKVQTLKVKELLEIQGVKVTFSRYCSGNSCGLAPKAPRVIFASDISNISLH